MKRKYGVFNLLNRGIALFLAAVMLLSGVPFGGAPRAQASSDAYLLHAGALLADSYSKFTETEKELLRMLDAGVSWTVSPPDNSDGLVTIDTDAKTITAAPFTSEGQTWTAVSAALYNRAGDKLEDVRLAAGEGSYTYNDSAFTAKVTYHMSVSLPQSDQEFVVEALQALAGGKKAADSVYCSADSLDMVVTVMDVLDMLRKGISYSLGGGVMVTLQFQENARKAVTALKKQYDANGGRLDLQLYNEIYASGSAAEYLGAYGEEYRSVAAETYGYLKAIAEDDALTMSMIDSYISQTQPGMASAWKTMKSDINKAVKALAPAAESWLMLEKKYIPAGLTAAEYSRMDSLIDTLNKQSAVTAVSDLEYVTALTAASAEISCSASMVEAELKAELRFYDASNTLVPVTVTAQERLEAGSELSQLESLAQAFEKDAVTRFENEGYDLAKFERSVSTDAPEILEGVDKVYYHITYTPADCSVTFAYSGQTQTLPMGWNLTLESYPDNTMVYEYEIDGTYYPQGFVYTVPHSVTVSRKAVKPAVATDLLSIIAGAYGTDKEAAILTSGALIGNSSLSIRWPDNDDGSLIVPSDGTLKAAVYNSGYNGLQWQPYSYKVNGTTLYFNGADTVTVNASGVDTIPVTYRLTLTDITAKQTQSWLSTATEMAQDAEGQLDALEKLNAQYSNIGQINKAILTVLKNSIYDTQLHEDWETNEELQDYLVEVVGNIIDDCVEKNGKLRIYSMLTEYRKPGTGGLCYYYRNSEKVIAEVKLLGGYLSDMLADELKINAVKILVESFGYPQYADRFVELEAIMNEVSNSLTPPNPAIDINNPNLDVLVAALTTDGAVGTTGAGQPFLEATFQVASPNKSTLQILVSVGDRVIGTVSKTYERSEAYVLTRSDVDDFREQLEAIVSANFNRKYYTESFDVALDSLVGRVMDSSITVKNSWTPVVYTVHIEGAGSQTVTAENLAITLPEPPTGFRYDYTVDGVICGAGTYRFTLDQLDRLFADGSYTVTCDKVNVAAERLRAFLDELNGAGGDVMRFTLNDDQDTVKVEVASEDKAALNASLQDIVLVMLGGYGYMGLDGEPMLYTTEDDSVEVSLQAIYDAVLHDSSFTQQTIIDLRDGEGRLATTTLQLGDSQDELEQDLKFEIWLTSASAEIVSLGNALASAENNLTFQANDGVLDVDLNLTEEMYQQLLADMLLTGKVNRKQLNGVTGGAAAWYMLSDMQKMVRDENVTMTTYENTLVLLGRQNTLPGRQAYYEFLAGALRTAELTEQLNGCKMLQTVDIKSGIDDALGDSASSSVLGIIKEYNTAGIYVEMYVTVEPRNNYQAMIIDDGGIRFTADLPSEVETVQGAVVLLQDVQSDLILADGAVLDLGGFDVTGNLSTAGSVLILDSSRATFAAGCVSGRLSGDFTLYGGRYTGNVSGYLPEGFVLDNGWVRDERYYVEENADGSLICYIHGDLPANREVLAMDILTDILMDAMCIARWDVDGVPFYDLESYALIQKGARAVSGDGLVRNILENLQLSGLEKLTGFLWEAPANYAADNGILDSVTVGAYPWTTRYVHVPEGDYLDVSLVTGDTAREYTVSLRYAEGTVPGALASIVTGCDIETENSMRQEFNADGSVSIVLDSPRASWSIDLVHNEEYATVLGVILAYGDTAIRSELAAAVNNGDFGGIRTAVESMSVRRILTALTKVTSYVDFAAMAKTAGITADLTAAAALEKPLHIYLRNLALELSGWTVGGTAASAALGSFKASDEGGTYAVSGLKLERSADYVLDGQTVVYDTVFSDVTLELKLFGISRMYEVLDTAGKTVLGTDKASDALSALKAGYTLQINRPAGDASFQMQVSHSFRILGAENLGEKCCFFFTRTGVQIEADAKLNAASQVSGNVVSCEKRGGTYVYTLAPIQVPTVSGGAMADVWINSKHNQLCVDVIPGGMTLNDLKKSLSFADLEAQGGTVNVSISGNEGSALVKTGDTLTISVKDGSLVLAESSYVLVVAGDVNKDGRVSAGDAVAMATIYNGNASSFTTAQLMAADTNRNGASDTPRVDAGDAVRIMTKYMDWESYYHSVSGK